MNEDQLARALLEGTPDPGTDFWDDVDQRLRASSGPARRSGVYRGVLVAACILAIASTAGLWALSQPEAAVSPAAVSETPTGAEILRSANVGEEQMVSVEFDFAENTDGRSAMLEMNLKRAEPLVAEIAVAAGEQLTMEVGSVQETTVLSIVSPSGLVITYRRDGVSDTELVEAGIYTVVIEAIGRSDRFTLQASLSR